MRNRLTYTKQPYIYGCQLIQARSVAGQIHRQGEMFTWSSIQIMSRHMMRRDMNIMDRNMKCLYGRSYTIYVEMLTIMKSLPWLRME